MAILCGLAVPAASAQNPDELPGLSLKLDWDLVADVGTPGVSRDELLDAEAPELRQRILKVRDRVASLEKANAEKSAYLDQHEALIQRMRGAVAAQEEVIARLSADADRPDTVAMAQEAATAPTLTPLGRPQVSDPDAPIYLGPIELPGVVKNYLMEGAFAVVLVLLLAWVLYLRSLAKARAAELTILRGGSLARPAPAAADDPELQTAPAAGGDSGEAVPNRPGPGRSAAASPPKRTDADTAPMLERNDAMVAPGASDSAALAEVDTLIADGDLREAKQLLGELTKGDEFNPEFRLRLLHVDSVLGDPGGKSEQDRVLAKMSEGTLSETRNRIKEIGRGLMPGHPLFDDDGKLEEAKRILGSPGPGGAQSGETERPQAEEAKAAASSPRAGAPPLILDLEEDHDTMDFLSDINFGAEDEAGRKG
jgi:hypothetical protein